MPAQILNDGLEVVVEEDQVGVEPDTVPPDARHPLPEGEQDPGAARRSEPERGRGCRAGLPGHHGEEGPFEEMGSRLLWSSEDSLKTDRRSHVSNCEETCLPPNAPRLDHESSLGMGRIVAAL